MCVCVCVCVLAALRLAWSSALTVEGGIDGRAWSPRVRDAAAAIADDDDDDDDLNAVDERQ